MITEDEFTPFTEEQWRWLRSRFGLDTKDAPKRFAEIYWEAEDVITAAKEQGVILTVEQAEAWWSQNEGWFLDSLAERGNEILWKTNFEEVK